MMEGRYSSTESGHLSADQRPAATGLADLKTAVPYMAARRAPDDLWKRKAEATLIELW
jgi:hypothetical protein